MAEILLCVPAKQLAFMTANRALNNDFGSRHRPGIHISWLHGLKTTHLRACWQHAGCWGGTRSMTRLDVLPFPTLEVSSSFGFNKFRGLDGITTQPASRLKLPSFQHRRGTRSRSAPVPYLLLDKGEAPQLVSEVVECLIWRIFALALALFGAPSCAALDLKNRKRWPSSGVSESRVVGYFESQSSRS